MYGTLVFGTVQSDEPGTFKQRKVLSVPQPGIRICIFGVYTYDTRLNGIRFIFSNVLTPRHTRTPRHTHTHSHTLHTFMYNQPGTQKMGRIGFAPVQLADMGDLSLAWKTFWLWNETFRRCRSQTVNADEVCMLTLQKAKNIRYPIVCGVHMFDAFALRNWILHCRRNGTRESVLPDVPLGTVFPAVCVDRVRPKCVGMSSRCACVLAKPLAKGLTIVLLFIWFVFVAGARRAMDGLIHRKEGTEGRRWGENDPEEGVMVNSVHKAFESAADLVLTINESSVVVFSSPSTSFASSESFWSPYSCPLSSKSFLTPTGSCSPLPEAASPCTVPRRGEAPASAPQALASRRRTAFLPSALPALPAAAPPPARACSSRRG